MNFIPNPSLVDSLKYVQTSTLSLLIT